MDPLSSAQSFVHAFKKSNAILLLDFPSQWQKKTCVFLSRGSQNVWNASSFARIRCWSLAFAGWIFWSCLFSQKSELFDSLKCWYLFIFWLFSETLSGKTKMFLTKSDSVQHHPADLGHLQGHRTPTLLCGFQFRDPRPLWQRTRESLFSGHAKFCATNVFSLILGLDLSRDWTLKI